MFLLLKKKKKIEGNYHFELTVNFALAFTYCLTGLHASELHPSARLVARRLRQPAAPALTFSSTPPAGTASCQPTRQSASLSEPDACRMIFHSDDLKFVTVLRKILPLRAEAASRGFLLRSL